jgi:hypothetical protein
MNIIRHVTSYAPLNSEYQAKNPIFRRDFYVYVLVIVLIMLANAFVRVYDETKTPSGEVRDAARFFSRI